MMKIYNRRDISLEEILERREQETADVAPQVRDILSQVQQKGDAALLDFTEQFDGVRPEGLLVTAEEWEAGIALVEKEFVDTLKAAKENIERYHKNQLRSSFLVHEQDGIVLGQKVMPMERVGIYVPGGTASYPSSVLMNAVPAKLAGVEEIVMVTPPDQSGNIPPAILAAARLAGVTRIVKCGGAQAVAALAYGTESVPKVDKIVGPGNVYVAEAKKQVYGLVNIDMIAGPSEILVVADESCNPRHVAADLLSQAEHDRMASAVLVTDSEKVAAAVAAEVEKQLALLPRREIAEASIANRSKIIVAEDIQEAVVIANAIAPEHLELCVRDPFALLASVKNAGSIFLGHYAPEALGDYFAGPNHVLPTNGTARFSSPLGVDDFIRKSSFVYYTKEALEDARDHIVRFAEKEGLQAHGRSVSVRFEGEEK